jgi:glycosyltransferase involved in cell wall biosynthesis
MSLSSRQPRVSVVMAVCNGARFLGEAINSIRYQTYQDFEFIIVDDGSTDTTPEMLAKHAAADSRIRILSQDNRGLIDSLHRGFAAAIGIYIARMDADDVAKLERLEMQVDFLDSNPTIALVGGSLNFIDAESQVAGTVWLPTRPEELRRDLREYGNAIAHPTVMFQRRALEAVGGFRKAYRHAEDYDLWLRMLERFDLANLQAVLVGYRRHEASVSFQNAKQQALSALCARTTARIRLEGHNDPTSNMDLITEVVLRDLGVTKEAIDAAVFKNMLVLTEEAVSCGLYSAAADFARGARPYAPSNKLAQASLELNRKTASLPGPFPGKRKHQTALLTADPFTYWKLFRPGMRRSNGRANSIRDQISVRKEASLFSVLIPVYNHANYVRQAVMSALRSPLVNEVLVVDDGSTDGSADILVDLAARYPGRIRDLTRRASGNCGAHKRLNELVGAARCSWVAVLNSDDVFVNGRFEAIVAHKSFMDTDFIFGNLLLMDVTGKLVGAKRGPFDPGKPFPIAFRVMKMVEDGNLLDLMAHQNCLGTTSNMIFTKDLHARIGGFASFRYVHDWDFALRAMVLGRCSYVRRYLSAYRMHMTNTINEVPNNVPIESRSLFDRLLTDFPQLAERPFFRIALSENVDLTKSNFTDIAEPKPARMASA